MTTVPRDRDPSFEAEVEASARTVRLEAVTVAVAMGESLMGTFVVSSSRTKSILGRETSLK